MDKQKLEEARQLAMSMTAHPVAFGTIEHTERAGELLGELVKANEALAREAHTWWTAAARRMLPEPEVHDAAGYRRAYTDEQMRAYAAQAVAAERERWQRIAENAQAVTTGGKDKIDHFEVPSHLMAALALALDEGPNVELTGKAGLPDLSGRTQG